VSIEVVEHSEAKRKIVVWKAYLSESTGIHWRARKELATSNA
jgi:hypothetical protein